MHTFLPYKKYSRCSRVEYMGEFFVPKGFVCLRVTFFPHFFLSSWMESEDFYLQPLPLFCRMMKALEIVWLFRLIFTDCRPTFSLSIVSTFLFTFLVDFNVIVRLRTNLRLYERTTCPWQIQKVLKQFSCASKVSLQKKSRMVILC